MANYILLERSRERVRGRARADGQGNFITAKVYATVYTLTFSASKALYDLSKLATPVYSKAWNYIDNPPPSPAWKALGPIANPQYADYPAGAQVPPRQTPANVPQGVTPVLPMSGRPGGQGVIVPGTSTRQLFSTTLKARRITVLADSANSGSIWCGYSPGFAVGNAFPLTAGAARDFDIDDLSQLYLLGENTTDSAYFIYEV